MRKRKLLAGLAAAVGIALVAAACSGNSGSTGSGGSTEGGSIVVSGSSTVEPISSLVAEKFNADNPDVAVKVDGPGTGDGFVLFCNGETDISDASRPIEPEEAQACKDAGIHYTELKVGLDGITVMTNPANSVDCLTKEDLYSLFGPESKGFKTWADANALDKELGGKGTFPDAPLDIVAPGQESGTYDAFIELALKDIADQRKQPDDQMRPDYQASPDDNVIIQGIEGSETSLGFVGFAYADQTQGQVSPVKIDGGDGCVAPSHDTIADGSFPLSRSLYIYVNTDKVKSNDALKSFVDFYMSDTGFRSVSEADYVALAADQQKATQNAWSQAGM